MGGVVCHPRLTSAQNSANERLFLIEAGYASCHPLNFQGCQSASKIHPLSVTFDLPLKFHPAATRAPVVLNRPRILDHRRLEFSGFIQGGGLVTPPGFIVSGVFRPRL
ncbi:hypothetical protein CHY08_12125 [Rhizobium leguminosarum bv. viciae]|nr:hypothetical protein CHY08_12125 [Rhizobium leguminosarum bv. viciae]